MFATIDDLEGQVELMFFGNSVDEYAHVAKVDEIVIIRGQLGNDDRGLVVRVNTCDKFDPPEEEVLQAREAAALVATGPTAFTLTLDAQQVPAGIIDELKHVFGNHSGESEVVLEVRTSAGERTLRLGPEFRVAPTPSLRAELVRILGSQALEVPQQNGAVVAPARA
jgi:DNA polymerase-3 subunit alpha